MKAIKILSLLLICFSLPSCMLNSFDEQLESTIDPSFKQHVDSFMKEGKSRNISINTSDLIIKFDNNNAKTDPFSPGICLNDDYQKTILINQYMWEHLPEINKEIIIFHELGHFMGLKHSTIKQEIMYLSGPYNVEIYSNERNYQIDNLFNKIKEYIK